MTLAKSSGSCRSGDIHFPGETFESTEDGDGDQGAQRTPRERNRASAALGPPKGGKILSTILQKQIREARCSIEHRTHDH
jgi:hypothetical protein